MKAAIGSVWHRQACAWFNSVIPVQGRKLFNAGCGFGHFMAGFEELGADVYGCDTGAYCSQVAKSRFGHKFFKTSFKVMRDVPVNYFDIVFCAATMEHIPEEFVHQVFDNLIKITRPNGLLYFEIVTEPDNVRVFPEESHVNMRSWGSWLGEMARLSYNWTQAYHLTAALQNTKDFPGFPLQSWKFIVNQKSNY